jgi:hypothetical protein
MSRRWTMPGAAAVVVAILIGVLALRTERSSPIAISTPTATALSPAAASPSSSPPATATATQTAASPMPSPSSTALPSFVSADMGYALGIGPPWRRASCGSSVSGGPAVGTEGADVFVTVPDDAFELGHVGPFPGGTADTIHVLARANPRGLSLREWQRMEMGGSVRDQVEDTTFAGHSALLVTEQNDPGAGRGMAETFLIASGAYVWRVGHRLQDGSTSLAERRAIVRSFRFLSADEQRAARAAATPSPAPRTPQQVADTLADGFAKRDTATLARVIRPCFYEGAYSAGPSSMVAARYLEALRQRFARGLLVDVRPAPIMGDAASSLRIRSTWREPGQPAREADLVMTVHRGTTYWDGTIMCMIGPCPP